MTHAGENYINEKNMMMLSKENSHLVGHIMLHTGDRLYQCRKCDKAFKENNHIVSNIIIQTREIISLLSC